MSDQQLASFDTQLASIRTDLDAEDIPAVEVRAAVRLLLEQTFGSQNGPDEFPQAVVFPFGEGGLLVQWKVEGKSVDLVGEVGQAPYIFVYRGHDNTEMIMSPEPATLRRVLHSLN
jgi:hypothetical protein